MTTEVQHDHPEKSNMTTEVQHDHPEKSNMTTPRSPT